MVNIYNADNNIDDSSKWQKLNNYYIRDVIEYKGEIVFCANEGIFNLKEKLHIKPAYCLATNNEVLVAGTNDGLLLFDSTWRKIEIFQDGNPVQVKVIKNYNNIFFLGHIEGSYGVTTWHPVKGVLYQHDFHAYVYSIEEFKLNILAGDGDGNIWLSDNMGRSFDSLIYLNNKHLRVRSIKAFGDNLFIGAGWLFKNYENSEHYITPTDFESNFVATGDQGVMIIDDSNNLVPFNEGLEDLRTSCLLIFNDELYCGTISGLYKRKLNKVVSELVQ